MLGVSNFERRRVGSFRAWMKTIAWRCWHEAKAKSERQQTLLSLASVDLEAMACEELEAAFDDIVVQELLHASIEQVRNRIEEKSWDAFRLTALEQMPAMEVAERISMKVDAVYAARCRVQRMISQEFKRLDHER